MLGIRCIRPSAFRAARSLASRELGSCRALHHPTEMIDGQAIKSWPTVAVGQMTSVGSQEVNFQVCKGLAEKAAAAGCSMLFLPECFSFLGASQPESLAQAQPLDGPLMQEYCKLASSNKLWLSLGGFQETGPDPGHLFNTHVIIDASGSIAAQYRKIHLFDVDVPNGPVLMESRTTAPGDSLAVCPSPVGQLGLSVCYDLRFPELYQKLVWEHGAQVLTVPSAFTKVTAAQAGKHNDKRESHGHSLIIDPWGSVVAKLEDPHATGIATAEINLEWLQAVRTKMPIQLHRSKGLMSLK